MAFKVGDAVKFLDEARSGRIISLAGNTVLIVDENGFEELVPLNHLVKVGSMKIPRQIIPKDAESKAGKKHKNKRESGVWEIDLHYQGELGRRKEIGNYEILLFQLEKAKSFLQKARRAHQKKLIFIHGLGEGKLRQELHEWLNSLPELEYFDASYDEYGGGATEVRMF